MQKEKTEQNFHKNGIEDMEVTPKSSLWLSTFQERWKTPKFRSKFLYSAAICLAYMDLGWIKGQAGPVLTELLKITGVDMSEGSLFRTMYYGGVLIGCLSIAVAYNRVYGPYLVLLPLLFLGVAAIATPWCTVYWVMVTIHFFTGACGGMLESVIAEAIRIWRNKSKVYVQILNFAFGLGSIIAPLATIPFLSTDIKLQRDISENNSILVRANESTSINQYNFKNYSSKVHDNNTNFAESNEPYKSTIIYAFMISAIMALIGSIALLGTGVRYKSYLQSKQQKSKHKHEEKQLSTYRRILAMTLCCFLIGVFNAVDYTFFDFLTLFCVGHMEWVPQDGALLTSVMAFAVLCSRFAGILIVKHIKSSTILATSFLALLFSHVGVVISAHYLSTVGLWVSCICVGISISITFPCMLSWTNESFIPLTGFVSSALILSAFAGAVINPIILRMLLSSSSIISFTYLFASQSCFCLIIFIVAYIYSIHYTLFGKTYIESQLEVKDKETCLQHN